MYAKKGAKPTTSEPALEPLNRLVATPATDAVVDADRRLTMNYFDSRGLFGPRVARHRPRPALENVPRAAGQVTVR